MRLFDFEELQCKMLHLMYIFMLVWVSVSYGGGRYALSNFMKEVSNFVVLLLVYHCLFW